MLPAPVRAREAYRPSPLLLCLPATNRCSSVGQNRADAKKKPFSLHHTFIKSQGCVSRLVVVRISTPTHKKRSLQVAQKVREACSALGVPRSKIKNAQFLVTTPASGMFSPQPVNLIKSTSASLSWPFSSASPTHTCSFLMHTQGHGKLAFPGAPLPFLFPSPFPSPLPRKKQILRLAAAHGVN